jgi:TonB family protein
MRRPFIKPVQLQFSACLQSWLLPLLMAIVIHIAFLVFLGSSLQLKNELGYSAHGIELWPSAEPTTPATKDSQNTKPVKEKILSNAVSARIAVEASPHKPSIGSLATQTVNTMPAQASESFKTITSAEPTVTADTLQSSDLAENGGNMDPFATNPPIFPFNMSLGAIVATSSYASRIKGRVNRLINFDRNVEVLESIEIEIYSDENGKISGTRILKSSGNPIFDASLLEAVERLQQLPRDVDGTIPSILQLGFNWTN